MADKADGSVVLAQLHGSIHRRLIARDLVQVVSHSPVFKIFLQTEVRTSIMSPPALTNFGGMLSTPPADFPSSGICGRPSTFGSPSVS